MLLMLSGASGAGKSTVLAELARRGWGERLECAEFDSIGVPEGADTAWRHAAVEQWAQHAVRLQESERDLLLVGQVPMGEILAAPSAESLDRIEVCVLHCSPGVRTERLRARGEPEESLIHHARFGEWFLRHTQDPAADPEVIRVTTSTPMRWDGWASWVKGDPRWAARVIHTDGLSVELVADDVEEWMRDALDRAGSEPADSPDAVSH